MPWTPRAVNSLLTEPEIAAAREFGERLPEFEGEVVKRSVTEAERLAAEFSTGMFEHKTHIGLYAIGGYARGGTERPDIDLLVATDTFGLWNQGDARAYQDRKNEGVHKYLKKNPVVTSFWYMLNGLGLRAKVVGNVPDSYRDGQPDTKTMLRAPALGRDKKPVDIVFVDMPTTEPVAGDLTQFENEIDVDESGVQLARIPLVKVEIIQSRFYN